jgi:DNA-binding NarL/FixJ family response regulator
MSSAVRVLLADDHKMFRAGLRSLLEMQPGVSVVGEAGTIDELTPLLVSTPCDVLLLDLYMDRCALLDIARFAEHVRVVVLTAEERPAEMLATLRAGARGVVFKHFGVDILVEAVRSVAAGGAWIPPALQEHLLTQVQGHSTAGLTAREVEIIRLVACGLRNAEVAESLFISEDTVKTHLNNIFHKLDLRDRVELTLHAIRTGIASPLDLSARRKRGEELPEESGIDPASPPKVGH